jgi:hypothetical protein
MGGHPSLCDDWVPKDNRPKDSLASASRTSTMQGGAQPFKNPQNSRFLRRHGSDIGDLWENGVLRAKTKTIVFI